MKKNWNSPEIMEMDIRETAANANSKHNGFCPAFKNPYSDCVPDCKAYDATEIPSVILPEDQQS